MESIVSIASLGLLAIILLALTVLIALAIYILIRYGRSTSITFPASIFAIIVFLILVGSSYKTLLNILAFYA